MTRDAEKYLWVGVRSLDLQASALRWKNARLTSSANTMTLVQSIPEIHCPPNSSNMINCFKRGGGPSTCSIKSFVRPEETGLTLNLYWI